MNRGERLRRTDQKLAQREKLMRALGPCGGSIFTRHRAKIESSPGYMRAGNVSHYINTKPRKKTRARNRYGCIYTPSKRDTAKLDSFEDQKKEDL